MREGPHSPHGRLGVLEVLAHLSLLCSSYKLHQLKCDELNSSHVP